MQTKIIFYQNLWNSAILSVILLWVRIPRKKFTQVLSYVVCTQVRRHVNKEITKRRYVKKTRTFCFWKTIFIHSRSRTYYALFLGYFCLKFLPDVPHRVCWVLAKIWAPDSSHKIDNKFFIHDCQTERKVRLCAKLCYFFQRWILDENQINEAFINEGRGHPPSHLKFFLLVFSKLKEDIK